MKISSLNVLEYLITLFLYAKLVISTYLLYKKSRSDFYPFIFIIVVVVEVKQS